MNKLTIAVALLLSACSSVPPGNVGVLVHKFGGDKGVDTEEVQTGRYWLTWNEEMYTFPTFSQTATWVKGPAVDESVTFQTSEGLTVNTDVGITYAVDPKSVTKIFQKYRKGIDEITDVYLRSMVRDAFVNESSSRPIESVYGTGKRELLEAVKKRIDSQTANLGIVVENIYWIGDLRLPPTVVESINAKIQATQKAQQRETEVAESRAKAEKAIAEARGTAESQLAIAKAEAEAIELRGRALRQYLEVIKLNEVEKWNGQLPTTMLPNAAIPIIK
jgi:regulator of protease activity HflC (stomatin/prohibitin superfamily)